MSSDTNRPNLFVVYDSLLGHATKHVRGTILNESFVKEGWRIAFVDYQDASRSELCRQAKTVDIIYLLKVADLRFVRMLRRKTSAKVIFDLTDALWRPNFKDTGWHDLDAILRLSHAVFCDSKYTFDYGKLHNANVFIIPACTNVEKFEAMRESREREIADREHDGTVVIGWIGSAGTASALTKILETLQRIFGRHHECRLRIVGCEDTSLLSFFETGRVSMRGQYDEDVMIREILGFDIGIFPAPSDLDDFIIRGPLKALLYMSARKPVVTLNAGLCGEFITDGVNGMLVTAPKEWEEKLERLISSKALRLKMGEAGFETVRHQHSVENVFLMTKRAFEEVLTMDEHNFRCRLVSLLKKCFWKGAG
jgi:glycosyltransferase involved in cell wall biosynthesis